MEDLYPVSSHECHSIPGMAVLVEPSGGTPSPELIQVVRRLADKTEFVFNFKVVGKSERLNKNNFVFFIPVQCRQLGCPFQASECSGCFVGHVRKRAARFRSPTLDGCRHSGSWFTRLASVDGMTSSLLSVFLIHKVDLILFSVVKVKAADLGYSPLSEGDKVFPLDWSERSDMMALVKMADVEKSAELETILHKELSKRKIPVSNPRRHEVRSAFRR